LESDFYDHPDLYDALLPGGGHMPFYAELARQQGGAVLELACGTGQLAVPIAAQGRLVVGLDQSRPMLAAAGRRAATAGAVVEFVPGDMRDFTLARQFGLIFVARNSLLHLLTTEDLLATFAAVKRHLAPGGIFAFDIFNPNLRLLARPADQRFPVMQVTTEAFGLLTVEQTTRYDAATQVEYATWYVSTPDRPDAWVVPLTLRNIFPQELLLLLSSAGFELVARFGELSREPFGSASRIQLCVCRPRP
jgi:SAM-dependent methyltransferase